MVKKIEKPVTFILSTGRTGTQFFSRYLTDTCQGMLCLHEPFPSRRFKWYSNFYLTNRLSKQLIGKQYIAKRKKVLEDPEINQYVESSNFLFGCVEPVKEFIPGLSVLHIIRHPITYTRSHLNKGFWSGIKGFTARNIPGWLEFLDPEIKRSGDPVLILMARWIYVNRVLYSCRNKVNYLNKRFEDIFSSEAIQPAEELNEIRTFLNCNTLAHEQQKGWLQKTANKSTTNRSEKWPIKEKHIAYIEKQGKDMLDIFNYNVEC